MSNKISLADPYFKNRKLKMSWTPENVKTVIHCQNHMMKKTTRGVKLGSLKERPFVLLLQLVYFIYCYILQSYNYIFQFAEFF